MKRILAALVLLAVIIGSAGALAAERDDWLSPYQYYYFQLSAGHREAWEKIIDNAMNYPDQDMQPQDYRYYALSQMIKNDNPRIFWIDWIDSNCLLRYDTGSQPHLESVRYPGDMSLAETQAYFSANVDAALAEIRAVLPANADAEDKVRAVYNWLCDNNEYNEPILSAQKTAHDPVDFAFMAAHCAYSAVIPGDAYEPVCDGYSYAFKIFCDELNVPCICVCGLAGDDILHVWNYARLDDGKWYVVDVSNGDTYDAGVLCLMNASTAAQIAYRPDPYLYSPINPDNGFTEGAAFAVPPLAD